MAVLFQMTGVKELDNALKQLPKATGKSVLRRALSKVLKPIALDMAAKTPRQSGKLRSSIHVGTALTRYQKRVARVHPGVTVYVGSNERHAHLIEWGHALVRGGNRVGHVPARPFARPAWDAGRARAFRAFKVEVSRALAKAAKTLAKKAQKGTLSGKARAALGG